MQLPTYVSKSQPWIHTGTYVCNFPHPEVIIFYVQVLALVPSCTCRVPCPRDSSRGTVESWGEG